MVGSECNIDRSAKPRPALCFEVGNLEYLLALEPLAGAIKSIVMLAQTYQKCQQREMVSARIIRLERCELYTR
jgi:hypothetical protein